MTLQEKSLYHQIHPLKLFTDWSTGFLALYFFWKHDLLIAIVIALIPSIIVSLILARFADLEKYKASAFGKYVSKTMTRAVEAIRFLGYAVMNRSLDSPSLADPAGIGCDPFSMAARRYLPVQA